MTTKKLLITIMLVVGFGTVISLWPEKPPHLPTAGTSIIVFGDSLAAGVGATAGNDIASHLTVALNRKVVNMGVPGDTTTDGLARVEKLLAADPRVVIILLGGNDALKQVPIETTFSNLAQIIELVAKHGAAVVLVGEPGGLYGNQYDKAYEQLAEEYRTFYVSNILSGLIGRTQYMSDYIHPNDAGYEIATSRILPVVREALSEGE